MARWRSSPARGEASASRWPSGRRRRGARRGRGPGRRGGGGRHGRARDPGSHARRGPDGAGDRDRPRRRHPQGIRADRHRRQQRGLRWNGRSTGHRRAVPSDARHPHGGAVPGAPRRRFAHARGREGRQGGRPRGRSTSTPSRSASSRRGSPRTCPSRRSSRSHRRSRWAGRPGRRRLRRDPLPLFTGGELRPRPGSERQRWTCDRDGRMTRSQTLCPGKPSDTVAP